MRKEIATTYTIVKLGCTPYVSGVATLREAMRLHEEAERVCQTGHRIYRDADGADVTCSDETCEAYEAELRRGGLD